MANIQNLRWDHKHTSRISREYQKKIRKPLPEEFWERVNILGPDECWPWIGPKHHSGYGVFSYKMKKYIPSRMSWELSNGPIPKGICVCHRCDNRPCVNPSHLFLGTRADNARDMYLKGRQSKIRGDAHHRTKITKELAKEIISLYSSMGCEVVYIANRFKTTVTNVYKVLKRFGIAVNRIRGANHCCAKLSEKDVLEIRRRYAYGLDTTPSLAKKFGVQQCTISRIINRKRWAHLKISGWTISHSNAPAGAVVGQVAPWVH